MSKVKDNLVTTGLSGKLGKQIVFRLWSGTTFLAKAPVTNQSSLKNEVHIKNMLRFKEAVRYAKKAMDDPELKQIYKSRCKERQTAYARAIQDFYDVPDIGEIDLSNYKGKTGGFIRVYVTDDFRVSRVQVRIEDEGGNPIEAGVAEQEDHTDWWRYVATGATLLPAGGKVVASAYDLPGNEAIREIAV